MITVLITYVRRLFNSLHAENQSFCSHVLSSMEFFKIVFFLNFLQEYHQFKSKCYKQRLCPSVHLHLVVCSISPEPFERFSLNFGNMFSSVRWCAELMTQLYRLKVKVTVKSHAINS